MIGGRICIAAALLVLAGCAGPGDDGLQTSGPPPLDEEMIAVGRPLYDTWCASCHGLSGEGQADWQTPRADGSFRPPPHDATGHTWHHSDALLLDLIANGSDFPETRMPAFGDRLDEAEILAILEYVKTWWGPEELGHQWTVMQQGR